LNELMEALRSSSVNNFPPTWKQTLDELGIADLFGKALADRIEEVFLRNQITTVVAQQEIKEIGDRLAAFEESIDNLRSGFSRLGIGSEELEPGTAELGVLIPRDFVENKLEEFAEELDELHNIFSVFAELAEGNRTGFQIRSISSSELSVFLGLSTKIAACIAYAVQRIIALYKNLLDIRKLNSEYRKKDIPEENLKGIEDYSNGYMDNNIEQIIPTLLNDFYERADGARKNELKIELRYSLRKIANRIDQGFNLEVRVAPQKDEAEATAEETKYRDMIVNAAPTLQFFKREGNPILSLEEAKEEQPEKKTPKTK